MIQAMPGKVILKRIKKDNSKNFIYITESTYTYQIVSIAKNDYNLKNDDFVVVDDTKLLKSVIDNEEYFMCKIDDIYASIE